MVEQSLLLKSNVNFEPGIQRIQICKLDVFNSARNLGHLLVYQRVALSWMGKKNCEPRHYSSIAFLLMALQSTQPVFVQMEIWESLLPVWDTGLIIGRQMW